MNMTLIVIAIIWFVLAFLAASFVIKSAKLNNALEKLIYEEIEKKTKQQELEAINDIQNKLKEAKKGKAPTTVSSAKSGDSSTRLKRLNSLSDKTDSKA